jgi:hypothetical protein
VTILMRLAGSVRPPQVAAGVYRQVVSLSA